MNEGNSERVAVISGASSGIGLVAAKALAAQGWRVVAMGRDPERSEAALESIRAAATPGARIDMIRADLSVMSEADRAAREIAALTDRIDVLINNAGGTSSAIAMTAEGNEAVFASNHLAPFLLTARLLPLLRKAAAGAEPGTVRIVNVSSSAHETSRGFDWDDLQSVGNYVPILAYCNAKLANVLFTRSLAELLRDAGIVSHAVHPGAVDSNFYDYADEGTKAFARQQPLISTEAGADTLIWLATAEAPGRETGGYFHERQNVPPSAAALDDAAGQRLWRESEKLIAANLGEPGFALR